MNNPAVATSKEVSSLGGSCSIHVKVWRCEGDVWSWEGPRCGGVKVMCGPGKVQGVEV